MRPTFGGCRKARKPKCPRRFGTGRSLPTADEFGYPATAPCWESGSRPSTSMARIAFSNGEYAGSVSVEGTQRVDLVLFEHKEHAWKDVTIYLPHNHEVRVFAVGLDSEAELRAPPAFALSRPIVCYGSSVLQGTGAAHPARTYPAATARRLNLDFVNLGFGGAGKGEVEVVALVNQLDACCYLFDLGKSYGAPTPERYNRMLDTIR